MRLGKRGAILGGIVLLAIVVRLVHVWQMSSDIFFAAPIIDARLNVDEARYLMEHSWWGPATAYWKPPLYSYLLAAQFEVAGIGYWLPRITQILIDAASCLLVYAIAIRLFSRRVAYASATGAALCGPLIYFAGELVSATLAVNLGLAFVYLTLLLIQRPLSRKLAIASGCVLGLTALTRPETLLLAPLLLSWLLLRRPRPPWRVRLVSCALFAGGVATVVLPTTVRNLVRGGDLVIISANGGINLFIGTDPAHGGMVGLRPGGDWERLVREPEAAGIYRVGGAHSRYFVGKALLLMAQQPGQFVGHTLKKAVLFWHGHELVSNQDLYRTRRYSTVMRATTWHVPGMYFPLGLVGPLALLGMAVALASRHRSRPLVAYVGVYLLVGMLFFVTARFRLPAVPVLIMFAAFAVEWLVLNWRRRPARATALWLVPTLAAMLVANGSWVFGGDRAQYARRVVAEEHHYRGTVLLDVYNRPADAIAALQTAAVLDPQRAQTYFNMGKAAAQLGRHERVLDAMRHVVVIGERRVGERYLVEPAIRFLTIAATQTRRRASDPFVLGLRCLARQDPACAVAKFEAAHASALAGMALASRGEALLRAGQLEAGIADLLRAAKHRPLDARTQLLLAAGLEHEGRDAQADTALARFRALEWPRGSTRRALEKRNPPPDSFEQALLILTRR